MSNFAVLGSNKRMLSNWFSAALKPAANASISDR